MYDKFPKQPESATDLSNNSNCLHRSVLQYALHVAGKWSNLQPTTTNSRYLARPFFSLLAASLALHAHSVLQHVTSESILTPAVTATWQGRVEDTSQQQTVKQPCIKGTSKFSYPSPPSLTIKLVDYYRSKAFGNRCRMLHRGVVHYLSKISSHIVSHSQFLVWATFLTQKERKMQHETEKNCDWNSIFPHTFIN